MVTAANASPAHENATHAALRLAVPFGLVFLSACGGLELSDLTERVSAIWIANGVLVWLPSYKPEMQKWPLLLLAGLGGNFSADLVMGDLFTTAAALTFCNGAGVMIVATPMSYLSLNSEFSRPKPLCVFYALGAGPAPIVSALMSATYFALASGRPFFSQALDWYATDALGYSIVVPILMTVRMDALRRMFARDQIVVTLLLLGTVAAAPGPELLFAQLSDRFPDFPGDYPGHVPARL